MSRSCTGLSALDAGTDRRVGEGGEPSLQNGRVQRYVSRTQRRRTIGVGGVNGTEAQWWNRKTWDGRIERHAMPASIGIDHKFETAEDGRSWRRRAVERNWTRHTDKARYGIGRTEWAAEIPNKIAGFEKTSFRFIVILRSNCLP